MRWPWWSWLFPALVSANACAGAPRGSDELTPTTVPRRLSVAELPAGARIRYVVRDDGRGLRTDRVTRATGDTVWLASGLTLPVAGLRRLDISRGGASEMRRMAWGTAIGAGVGGILGALVPPDTANHHRPHTRGDIAIVGALYGMIVGGGAGLLVWPGEDWEPVARPQR